MRLAVTFLGLDLFSLEVSTEAEAEGDESEAGDSMTYPIAPGFYLPEREGGASDVI